MKALKILVSFVFALAVLSGLTKIYAEEAASKTTLDNLITAYNGESNAHERYLAFAKKADEEGFLGIASLFRAAAQSEKIHLESHARVIKKLGGTPKAALETPVVKTTKENLEAALKGESYERDTMYPDFIKQAQSENLKDAVRTFNRAKGAETEHAKLYADALKNMDALKTQKKDFFVCPECGFTTPTLPEKRCPICGTSKDKFLTVN